MGMWAILLPILDVMTVVVFFSEEDSPSVSCLRVLLVVPVIGSKEIWNYRLSISHRRLTQRPSTQKIA